jgi:hypothetical protein
MTSLLKPSYALTLGSQQWTEQLLSIDLRLEAAPLPDVLRVRLPAAATLKAQVGDDVKLKLDNGEKGLDVFAGTIDSMRRGFSEINITALNASGKLARYRPATTYEQITVGTLIRNLCGDVGVEVGSVEDGATLAFYVADPSRTALEHVARVCAWSGALARVTPDNKLESLIVNATQSDVALKYGRELMGLNQGKVSSAVESFVVAGESGVGATSAPEALRPTTDFFGGNRPDGPSANHRWLWEPALRTAQAAGTAGAALDRIYKSSRDKGTLEAFLQPDLRAGVVFEIQELPDGLDKGPFWVAGVNHQLSSEGCLTRARFYQGGDSFDPLALLGSLGSALSGF